MNRRNVLIGIGTAAVGSGVALGSGAFTSVEATRNINLSAQGDSAALLQFVGDNPDITDTESDDDDSVDMLEIEQTALNADAVTRFNDAITVTNTGSDDVGFYVDDSNGITGIDLIVTGTSSPEQSIIGSTNAQDISASSGTLSLDVKIDLTDGNGISDLPTSITFVADTEAHSGA